MQKQDFRRTFVRDAEYGAASFGIWVFLALLTGALVGAAGTLFSFVLHWVNAARAAYPQLLWGLPAAGVLIVFLYHIGGADHSRGTNLVLEAVRGEAQPPAKMAPLIFVSTAITHLFGGSAGREGAALQLGGSIGSLLGHTLRLDETKMRGVVMCGMSAAFAALFGTPLTAAVFSLELAAVGVMRYGALVPCALSAVTASSIAAACGVEAEGFSLAACAVTPVNLLRMLVLGALCAGVGILLCIVLHAGGHLAARLVSNMYLRAALGGALIIGLTLLLGTRDYLGAGMDVIARAVEEGETSPGAFLFKMLFTSITLGCGFKGGEIVPTFFVGATFGCAVGGLLGLDPCFAAAVALICLFCAVTNCPMASLLLAFELFGFVSPALFLVAVSVSYMISGYYSLYSSQLFTEDKLNPVSSPHQGH